MHQRVLAGDAVDEDVEAAALALDTRDEGLHLCFNRVIDAHGDGGAAAARDHVGGLFNRLGPPVRRRLAAHAAAGAEDHRTSFAERARDAAAGAARRAGYQRDLSVERA